MEYDQQTLNRLALIFGLTKNELKKRLELGLIDEDLLARQVNDNALDTKFEALCENYLDQVSEDQIDKSDRSMISAILKET